MGWWTDVKKGGNAIKQQVNTAIPRDLGELLMSIVGGPIGITEFKKSKAVGEKAKETDAFDKTSKRRAAIDRALGGNPLGRSLDAPKPLDMTPWASHDIGKSVMSKFF
jgi:hypothetical protein